jgi:probable HAF family extracellular repeat protein
MRKSMISAAITATAGILLAPASSDAGAYTFAQIDVPFIGASDTIVFGINDRGEVVGSYRDAAFQLHGFFRDADANFTPINVPFLNASNTAAYGLNNQGQIVGSYNTGAFQNLHGFLAQQGQFNPIDVPFSGSSNTEAFGINGQGDIVGGYFLSSVGSGAEHGFLATSGGFTTLEFPSAGITEANGVNNTGQIVGDFSDADFNQHGFIFKDGGYHAIDDPSATNGTAAIGVNDLGQIVGDYFAGEFGGSVHGFLLDAGGFDTIDVPFAGGLNTVIRGINNQGDIVGLFSDLNGNHGFIASPQTAVPEPSSVVLLGFAIAALLWLSCGSGVSTGKQSGTAPCDPQSLDP